jgi:hypothetical protein
MALHLDAVTQLEGLRRSASEERRNACEQAQPSDGTGG